MINVLLTHTVYLNEFTIRCTDCFGLFRYFVDDVLINGLVNRHNNHKALSSLKWLGCGCGCFTHHSKCLSMSLHDLGACKRSNKVYRITVASHDGHGHSEHRQLNCLFNRLSRYTSKKTRKLCAADPLWGKFTGDRWIPLTKSQYCGKRFQSRIASYLYGS